MISLCLRSASRMPRSVATIVSAWALALTTMAPTACEIASPTDPGALLPPTAERDPALPRLALTVAGHEHMLHLETFGSTLDPVVFAFHGGGGNDYRALLPLRALAQNHFLVMWDSRGSGLSERIPRAEISWDSYVEEVDAVKRRFSPNQTIALIGYSSGGFHAALYVAQHPEAVSTLVLIEPDALSREAATTLTTHAISLADGFVNEHLWQTDFLSPSDHDQIDRKAYAVARDATADLWCDPKHPGIYPFWRHGIFVDIVSTELKNAPNGYDFSDRLHDFAGPVLFVGSDCGPLRADWQVQQGQLARFPHADLLRVPGKSHSDLFTEDMVVGVRDWLAVAGANP